MHKTGQRTVVVISTSAEFLLAYLALVKHNDGAWRLLSFWLVTLMFAHLLVGLFGKVEPLKVRRDRLSQWLGRASVAALVGILVWFDHSILAFFYGFSWAISASHFELCKRAA